MVSKSVNGSRDNGCRRLRSKYQPAIAPPASAEAAATCQGAGIFERGWEGRRGNPPKEERGGGRYSFVFFVHSTCAGAEEFNGVGYVTVTGNVLQDRDALVCRVWYC